MPITSRRPPILRVVLALLVAALGLLPLRTLAQDEQRFADLLAQRDDVSSLAGPFSGQLAQQDGFSTVSGAGVFADSFSATATFENPATPGSTPWDFGFVFHQTDSGAQQFVVDSDGNWYYSPYPDGTLASGIAATVDSAPGATNTLDLVVADTNAVVGINGEFVTRIDLPPAVASDVQVGTGFFTNTTEAGRTVNYLDFEVWPVGSDTATLLQSFGTPENGAESTVTPEPEATPESETGQTSDQEAFAFLLDFQEQASPVAGPFTANLKEEPDRIAQSWAGVDLDAFHAHATFTVPAASETPWDVGFMFGTSPNGTLRIAVDALGNWYYSIGNGGPANRGTVAGLNTDPGGENTIDLFVAEQRAVVGVNGNFVSNIELPDDSAAGDVAAGSAFYSDQTEVDRLIAFHDFTILPFDPNAIDATEGSANGPSDADRQAFASFLADTQSLAPAVGPFAGRLVEASSGTVPQAAAGIALADFGAVATFTNPEDLSTALWDAGFQFRSEGDQTHRFVLRSNGDVYAVLADGTTTVVGNAATYDATSGASNDIQLFVQGDRALFGVNGELSAAVTLPEEAIASDILVGASFFSEDYVQGRVTGYEGFSVWQTT